MRLIDAEPLREYWLEETENAAKYHPNDVLYSIDDQPTVDAVPPEIRVLLEALRKLDWSCDYCAHRDIPHEDCNGECQTCSHDDCRCKTCRDNSNWEWNGGNHRGNEHGETKKD